MKFALGKKLGMTTIYNDDGAQNVTLIEVVPNVVNLIRTEEKDGYNAVCVTIHQTKKKKISCEFRVDSVKDIEIGKELSIDMFETGDTVSVSATAKAKGFQGVVKRYNFAGGPATHGHRHALRSPGSIGSAYPQHVMKGKRMAGRMGGKRATCQGIKVIHVDKEQNIVAIKGSVPGVAGRIVEIIGVS